MGLYFNGCGLPGGSRERLNRPRWMRLGGVSKGHNMRGDTAVRARRWFPPKHMQFLLLLLNNLSKTQHRGSGAGGVRCCPKYAEKTQLQPSNMKVRVLRSHLGNPKVTPSQASCGINGGKHSGFPQSITLRCKLLLAGNSSDVLGSCAKAGFI